MWRLDRRAYATVALIAVGSLAGISAVDARGENAREGHEHRHSEAGRQTARRQAELRQSRVQSTHAAAHRDAPHALVRPVVNAHREAVTHLAGGGQARELSRGSVGQVHVVRYGNALSGTVERTIRPGLVSRSWVSGGHVLYTHAYQSHVWHQFGRSFAYETFVPPVRFPAVYYAWALAPWSRPVIYSWGWQVQPWYPLYGAVFTPYPVYASPDLWMTDYILAQSMQTAYQAQSAAAPPSAPSPPQDPAAPTPDLGIGAPVAPPSEAAPTPQPIDEFPAAPAGDAAPAPQSTATLPAPVAPPPVITPEVKAQLNAQIKVQLREQQAAVATPATLTSQSTPPALRPNHVFFEVVQPLDVPTANGHCTLSANDYIKRTGGMSGDDWMIPAEVELSRPSDCPEGLRTRIGLNDFNAMENEQEARVLEAMRAASKGIGPHGPPSGVHPTLIADGNAAPDPSALDAIRQAQ